MAVKHLFASTEDTFKVVSRRDDSLEDDITEEEYGEYLKTLDESLLRRKEGNNEPFTYFHMRISSKLDAALKNSGKTVSLGQHREQIFKVANEVVSDALVDITCEGVSLFEKGKDGKPAERLMLGLLRSLILVDLFAAMQARESTALELTKKN